MALPTPPQTSLMQPPLTGSITVGDYLRYWLSAVASSLAPATAQRYRQFAMHVIAQMGPLHLDVLTSWEIQQSYALMLDARGAHSLAPRTVLHTHRMLKQALAHAVTLDLLVKNPCDAVIPPRPGPPRHAALTSAQVEILLRECPDPQFKILIELAVHTGMRKGELLGLQWQDVDLELNVLRIERSIQYLPHGVGLLVRPPKTRYGRRSIAVSAGIRSRLRDYRAAARETSAGSFVFCRPDGQPLRTDSVSAKFRRLAENAGLAGIRFHDLRHTSATLLLGGGIHPKVVSERLGHANVSITLDMYGHSLPHMQREAAELISQVLAGIPSQEGSSTKHLGGGTNGTPLAG